jgi:hypothetical protein
MASSSSSTRVATVVLQPMADKLSKSNHTVWRAQVLATLRGAHLEGFVTGKKKAPVKEIEEQDDDKKTLVANPDYED